MWCCPRASEQGPLLRCTSSRATSPAWPSLLSPLKMTCRERKASTGNPQVSTPGPRLQGHPRGARTRRKHVGACRDYSWLILECDTASTVVEAVSVLYHEATVCENTRLGGATRGKVHMKDC